MRKIPFILFALILSLSSCKSSQRADLGDGLFANIKTTKGDIIVKLEHEIVPVTVANFVSLAEGKSPFVSEEFKGKKYYDGLTFHRVMKDFMIQGGDPTATGTGSPGYRFKDEFTDSLSHYKKGILSMANGGPATNGSQFFITHKPTLFLDAYQDGVLKPCANPRVGCHTVFGEVVEGIEVVDSIAAVPVASPGNKPLTDVVMNEIVIIRNGKNAKKFDAVEVMTAYFAEEEERIAEEKRLIEEAKKYKGVFAQELVKQKEEATELPSGLRILKITDGTGEKPKLGQKVHVYYAGYLMDGGLFETNYEDVAKKFAKFDESRKQQGGYGFAEMDYTQNSNLVAGFKEGLLSMKVGDKVRLFIPSHLAWGPTGGGPIPPNAEVVFDLEIVGIK